jgi:lipopolysaccharide transport system permease protein
VCPTSRVRFEHVKNRSEDPFAVGRLFADTASASSNDHLTTIAPTRGLSGLQLRRLWEFRELVYLLIKRDVKIRYTRTAAGTLWTLLQPVVLVAAFAFIFGRFVKVESVGVAYPIFVFAGLLPWQLFVSGLAQAAGSVIAGAPLLTKVYFPRLILPIAAVLGVVIDLAAAAMVLVGLLVFYGVGVSASVAFLPLLSLLVLAAALAVGTWLAALTTRYRDLAHTVPMLTQILFFLTPVAYPASLVPDRWRALYELNPMVGIVEGFRAALLGQSIGLLRPLAVSIGVIAVLLVTGAFYFRRVERTLADEL